MTLEEMDAYMTLVSDWGGMYAIAQVPGEKPFRAQYKSDPGDVMMASTPKELRELIRDDYVRRK